jgi:uncharacterized protein (TIGR02421 family)
LEEAEKADKERETPPPRGVVSHPPSVPPEKADKTDKIDKAERAEKADKLEKAERVEKLEKADRLDKAERAEKAEKLEKAEKADKLEKAERAEQPRKAEDSIKSDPSILGDGPRPSIPPPPVAGPWRSYKEVVANLAARIVEAQKPIRVLQSLRWENAIEEQFLKGRGRELPKVDPSYYDSVDLGFDPKAKSDEFEAIARDIDHEVGETDAIGGIMAATAIEYRDVVRMLSQRGKPLFYAYSRKLYGSPKDKFPDGKSTVRDLGHVMYEILTKVDDKLLGQSFERNLTSADVVAELTARFARYFDGAAIQVTADDSIIADAAAGSDYVKVRTGAKFSQRDIDILEVHEGWVHVATSLNGQQQTVAKWLAKGPPRTVAVQEGLAALLEIFTFRMYPRRARRLNDRILAIDKAEDGASFLDVYEWFRTEGYDEEECFHNTRRIFRGGVLEGGAPFTKDACYCKGVVLNYAFIWSAIQQNRADLIPYLFVGKVAHEDVPVLARRATDGVIRAPRYLPPMFRDLNGLAMWMAYSTFFARLDTTEIANYYSKLFARTG